MRLRPVPRTYTRGKWVLAGWWMDPKPRLARVERRPEQATSIRTSSAVTTVEAIDIGEIFEPVFATLRHRVTNPGCNGPILAGELFRGSASRCGARIVPRRGSGE
jgi:hypothetical protein